MLALYTESIGSALLLAIIKEKYYPEEEADLFYISSTVEEGTDVLRRLETAGIFRNIYVIDYPSKLQPTDGRFGKIPKVRKVLFSRAIYDYFQFFLHEYTKDKRYSRLIVPHLGDSVQYTAYFFTKNYPELEICFYGEGADPYGKRAKQYLSRWGPRFQSWKNRVMAWFGEHKYLKPLRRFAKPVMYMQAPQRSGVDPWFQDVYEIPNLLEFPRILELLRGAAKGFPLYLETAYSRRRAVFYASAYSEKSMDALRTCKVMQRDYTAFEGAASVFGMKGVLLRPVHELPLNRELLAYNAEQQEGLFVDRVCSPNWLTPLLSTCPERLILMGNDPGILSQCKFLYGVEPYIVFTYRLTGNAAPGYDAAASALRRAYRRPERITVPATEEDLEKALIACRNDLYDMLYLDSEIGQAGGNGQ